MWANRGPGVSRGVSTSDLTSQGRGGVLQLPRLSLYSGPISWDYGMSKQAMHDYMPIEYEDMAFIRGGTFWMRSEEHTSELQSLMRNSYAVFCFKKKKHIN